MNSPFTRDISTLKHDHRDVVGVLVFVVGVAGFGIIPVLSMLDRLI